MTQERPYAEEERRLVTVLFADLVGYTTVSEARDPELIQEALDLCFQRLAEEIVRFGGYVDKVTGDQIMALFGAPRAQEDDAGKAIAAGLAMQRALRELSPTLHERLGQGLSMRVGINTGLVVTGAVGPGGYTVTGDAVNVAARLESTATPGTILVGDATRRLARRQFVWSGGTELTVKGRVQPVLCYTVEELAAAPLGLVPAPSATPFVGREEHLDLLRRSWEAASTGAAQTIELVGEAGIGKTRLLAHLFYSLGADVSHVLYTRADTPPRTFGPLVQLLPSLRPNLPREFEERIEALAQADEAATPPEVERTWLIDGLVDVIRRLSETRPVALVLDDLHRADRATIAVLERLLPRLSSLPVLTLLLRQPTGLRVKRLPNEASITLEPISDDQARALIAAVAPSLPEDTATQIISRAGGNPLYLELLATSTTVVEPEHAIVPETLQTAVVARIDELDETHRQLLREASVFGQSFHEEPLKLTTSVTEGFYEALDHLCQIGLLDELHQPPMRGYQFRHSLVRDVIYEGLLRRHRLELHRRAAEALELYREEGAVVEPEQMAFHYQEAGNGERAAAYYLAAADRAEYMRAPVAAREHRRTANRLLNAASLAALYGGPGRPALAARLGAAGLQALIAVLFVLPVFLIVTSRRPEPNLLTLGLPLEITEVNASSVMLAVVLGGLPLLLAGIAFAHLAVPVLMRRRLAPHMLAGVVLGGWACGLVFVLLGYGALVGLLRLNALDRISSMYVGAATLRFLLGDLSLVWTVLIGTLVLSLFWTGLLRFQARGWARLRRSVAGPRELEEGRRWAIARQLGLLATIAGVTTVAVLIAYQFGLLPHGGAQDGLTTATFGALIVPFGALGLVGAGTTWRAARRLRRGLGAYQLGSFGFEVPLILALAFGFVAWFGMRQAVVVSANDVDTPGSVAAFDRAVDLFPDLGMAYYLRGERYLADGDFRAARADFDQAIELDPDFPATYLARGRVLIELGEFEGAIADANRLIQLRPEHPGGYTIRAWAHSQMGDLDAAAADFDRATRPLPEDAQAWDAYFIRCLALAAVERLDEAEQDCLRVLDLNPGHIVSLDTLALIEFDRGEYEAGIEYTSQIIDIDPTNALAWANRGEAYATIGRYMEAEADMTQALELAPGFARAHLERGFARLYLGRPDDALADLDLAVERYQADPEGEEARGLRPNVLYATRLFVALHAGDHQTAILSADTLLELGFEDAWVWTNRGLAKLEQGDLEDGLADIDRALELDPNDALGYDRRGYGHYLLGDYAQAQDDFDEALRRFVQLEPQERAELHYHRALLFREQERYEEALAELDEAASLVEIPNVRQHIDEARRSIEGLTSGGGV